MLQFLGALQEGPSAAAIGARTFVPLKQNKARKIETGEKVVERHDGNQLYFQESIQTLHTEINKKIALLG